MERRKKHAIHDEKSTSARLAGMSGGLPIHSEPAIAMLADRMEKAEYTSVWALNSNFLHQKRKRMA